MTNKERKKGHGKYNNRMCNKQEIRLNKVR